MKEHDRSLILSMAGKIFASKGGSEKGAIDQAEKILKIVQQDSRVDAEHGLVADVAATIFASPTKSGTTQNIDTAITQAASIYNAVFHP
jgi:hypothetical protein